MAAPLRDALWATDARIRRVFELGGGNAPYPHQVEGVRKVLQAIQAGDQKRFLHYYAPRTGKTMVQAGIAYWMMQLRNELGFSLVVIINDREFLDSQSYEAVESFIEKMKLAGKPWQLPAQVRVVQADTAKKLRKQLDLCERFLAQGADLPTILFTTFQKLNTNELMFKVASHGLASRTLVVPDEVHRSHTEYGSLTQSMERVLGASYFVALTGTPNRQALERFGTLCPDGLCRPFHSYHLGNAVSDGLVMDPRVEYNEVVSIVSGLEDSSVSAPEKSRLQRLLSSSSQQDVLLSRVHLVLEHFSSVSATLSYQAQAMVLCSSREEVLRATRAAQGLAWRRPDLNLQAADIIGAFSGRVSGESEKDLNGFLLKSAADAKKARVLFVAHKFERGYDNAALTFLYVFRRIDAGSLATQVLLRHCSKRIGKIRPITIDFANQDGQLLMAMSMYFGDIAWRPGGEVVCDPIWRQRSGQPVQSSSRKAIEKHLLSRIRLERLEVRPVASPLQSATLTTFKSIRHQQQSEPMATSRSESRNDALILKILPPDQVLGEMERASLARLASRAEAGHLGTLKALSNCGTAAAMKKVLMNGSTKEKTQAKTVLCLLRHTDSEAASAWNLVEAIGCVTDKPAAECLSALQSLITLLTGDAQLLKLASALGACQAGLRALTRFSSFELDFGNFFGSFSTPFFAGRNADFFQKAWALVALLAPCDDEAAAAIVSKQDLADLRDFSGPSAASSTALQRLGAALKPASKHMLEALIEESALESLRRVLAYGSLSDVTSAESILTFFASISAEARKLASLRLVLGHFSAATTFDNEDVQALQVLYQKSLPRQPDIFAMFSGDATQRVDIEGQIIRRFGLKRAAQQLALCAGDRHAEMGRRMLATLTEEGRSTKRLRTA